MLSVRPHFSNLAKQNNVRYRRDCGSGRVDHWWHLSCCSFFFLFFEKMLNNCWLCCSLFRVFWILKETTEWGEATLGKQNRSSSFTVVLVCTTTTGFYYPLTHDILLTSSTPQENNSCENWGCEKTFALITLILLQRKKHFGHLTEVFSLLLL